MNFEATRTYLERQDYEVIEELRRGTFMAWYTQFRTVPKYIPHAFICEIIKKHIGAQNMLSYFRSHYIYTIFNRTRDAFKPISSQRLSVVHGKIQS